MNVLSIFVELIGLYLGDYYLVMSMVDKLGMESEKFGVVRIDID